MTPETWAAVDRYVSEQLIPTDASLEAALQSSSDAQLPSINVTPNQGKLLHLLARMQAAKRILEIGTLGGYSTIWLARALQPGGKLTTLELDPKHAEVARKNFARASVADVIDLRVGRAIDTLPHLAAEKAGPFDFIFIDADKASIPDYLAWSLKLSRPGTVIVVDNVVRKGGLVDAASTDGAIQGVRRMHEQLAMETRCTATTIQTVGAKGYDGFTLIWVNR